MTAKILFLTQIVPYPPDAGPKVKTWHVLRALAKQGHDVTLISFVRPEELQYLSVLRELCTAVQTVPIKRSRVVDIGYLISSYLKRRPFLIERDDLKAMQQLVQNLVQSQSFDFIHADQLTMVQFAVRSVTTSLGARPKVIFDAHNAVWTIVKRMRDTAPWFLKPVLSIEANRVKAYEGYLLRTVDTVLAVTEMDRTGLEEALAHTNASNDLAKAPITVIPIAVDTSELQPISRTLDTPNILTLGTLHYPPNADGIRWFVQDVYPIIQRENHDVTLTIVGKNPPRDFLEFAARYPQHIKVTGYAPDLRTYLRQSTLMVIPVRSGGGMRVRILEAFAYGMPVVTTSIGLEGIDAVPGQDVLVADTASQFADHVIELLRDTSLQEKLSQNGRRLAETRYDWQFVLSALKTIYE